MDFDSVEKTNKLAKTLKDNGLAANLEEAMTKAIEILGKELNSESITAKETINENEK